MKPALCFVLFAAFAWADETADRAAIAKLMAGLNALPGWQDEQSLSRFFTLDAQGRRELGRLANTDRLMLEASQRPWSEVSSPRFVSRSVRFIAPGVALVDAANTQYGSLILARRIPVLLILRKEGTGWRIVTLRTLVDCAALSLP